jgi:glycerate dehydrogenase/D-3-phosphoglycerate dehydrogenase
MAREAVPADLLPALEAATTPDWYPEGPDGVGDAPEAEILVTANANLGAAVLARFRRLRTIVTTGTAIDYVDLDHCLTHGIAVCNTPDYTGSSVAEHAIALLLAVNRRLTLLDAAVRAGRTDTAALVSRELHGRTAGVVGLGDIGSRFAGIAQGCGMKVCFTNRSPKEFPGAVQVDLPTLLRESDVVFLSLPLTAATHHLLGEEQFAMMKPNAIVVNISADELINPVALGAALASGRIAGAGLDVIGSPEPFLKMPNTVLTPAHAWYTVEAVRRRAATWVRTTVAAAEGKLVNRVA